MKELNDLYMELIRTLIKRDNQEKTSPAQIFILKTIKNTPLQIGEVARNLNITLSGVTALSDKLVHQGFVERKRGEKDRRIVELKITKKGEKKLLQAQNDYKKRFNAIHGGLKEEEKKILIKTYKKIITEIKKEGIKNEC